ncbi:MAG: VOC family protein [Clostridia bacterium]|nr:VOC family protein [Clostridia bacterium]
MELGYVTVFTQAFEAEVEFYEGVLGLRVEHRSPHFVRFETGSCALAVHQAEDWAAGSAGAAVQLHLRVDDVDAAYARLSQQGVRFEHAPRDMPWGLRVAALRDPAGLYVELYAPSAR